MGIGDEKALKILQKVHTTFGVPTVTDIHAAEEATMAAEYVDILQICLLFPDQNQNTLLLLIAVCGINISVIVLQNLTLTKIMSNYICSFFQGC